MDANIVIAIVLFLVIVLGVNRALTLWPSMHIYISRSIVFHYCMYQNRPVTHLWVVVTHHLRSTELNHIMSLSTQYNYDLFDIVRLSFLWPIFAAVGELLVWFVYEIRHFCTWTNTSGMSVCDLSSVSDELVDFGGRSEKYLHARALLGSCPVHSGF